MLQPPVDQISHRVMHLVPGGGCKPWWRKCFPNAPRHFLTTTPHCLQVDPPHAINQKDQVAPDSDELKPPQRGRLVVARRGLMTARANGSVSFPRPHRSEEH